MPIIESAKKALRQNRRRRTRNIVKIDAYKDAAKKFKKLIAENKREEAMKLLSSVYQALDKAAKTNVIAKNKASRLKSRLAKRLKTKEGK